MSTEPTASLDGTLKTSELQARLEVDLGLIVNARTIRHWVERPENPCPVAYKGKNGQAHRFRWVDFLLWYEAEQERQAAIGHGPASTETDIDQIDWHAARTISARERAKRDRLETRRLEGKYGDIQTMEQAAEDFARQAVNLMRALPARLAPVLVGKTELEIDRLLDADIREICQTLERTARAALTALDADDSEQPPENTEKNDENALAI